jgi:hypothetical protein
LGSGRMRSLTGGVCIKLLTKLRHNLGEYDQHPPGEALGGRARWRKPLGSAQPTLLVNQRVNRSVLLNYSRRELKRGAGLKRGISCQCHLVT